MFDLDTLVNLVSEYRDYVVPVITSLGTLVVRELPRLTRWAAASARFTGRFVYSCVIGHDSDVVKSILETAVNGDIVTSRGYERIVGAAGTICLPYESLGVKSPLRVCRGDLDLTAGLTASEVKRVTKVATARIAAVRKAEAERNAVAARQILAEQIRNS